MELRSLRYFVAVAKERNFTRAARRIGVAQPALSQQVGALERELGVVLIDRSNRTGDLTDAGRRLFARAERILGEVRDAGEEMADFAGARRGVVRIGCALQTLMEGRLPPLLAELRASHPGIRVVVRELHTRQVLELLDRGQVELGLVHLGRVGDAPPVGAERAGEQIALLRLHEEPLVLIVAPAHRLAARARIALDELADEPWVMFGVGSTIRQLVMRAARQRGFAPKIAFATTNLGTVRALVSAGLGVAAVPQSALDVPHPPLSALRLSAPRLERIVTLARNRSRYESQATLTVRDLLTRAAGAATR